MAAVRIASATWRAPGTDLGSAVPRRQSQNPVEMTRPLAASRPIQLLRARHRRMVVVSIATANARQLHCLSRLLVIARGSTTAQNPPTALRLAKVAPGRRG